MRPVLSLRLRFVARDPYLTYSAALVPIAALVLLLARGPTALVPLFVLSTTFIGAQFVLGQVPARRRPMTTLGWSFLRLTLALLFVWGLVELSGGGTGPLVALFIPVVVAAAALGPMQTAAIGAIAMVIYLAPEIARVGSSADIALRGITLAGVTLLVALGVRRLVVTVERTTRQLRSAVVAERRRSRQIAGLEAVSRLLVAGGPTGEVLDRALGVLVERFGYANVSIYLADGDRVVLGAQRESLILNAEERKATAFHEGGHALLATVLPHGDPLHKVTILPRGMALGVTWSLPQERHTYSKEYFEDTICKAMGGRVAEKIVFGHLNSGAANDLEQATNIARRMVREWGMSDAIGPMAWHSQQQVFLGEDLMSSGREYSDETAKLLDAEIARILHGQEQRAFDLLTKHRRGLDMIAEELLEHETIDGPRVAELIQTALIEVGSTESIDANVLGIPE